MVKEASSASPGLASRRELASWRNVVFLITSFAGPPSFRRRSFRPQPNGSFLVSFFCSTSYAIKRGQESGLAPPMRFTGSLPA